MARSMIPDFDSRVMELIELECRSIDLLAGTHPTRS